MQSFSDRLIDAVRKKANPCVVGLDPRIELMPCFIRAGREARNRETVCSILSDFHELILDAVTDLVPAVKPQLAFFEQYGLAGMEAYENTVQAARQRGLLVIADAKRNDIASTAEAYATAFLGEGEFSADSLTVTPYLGKDSLLPFINACAKRGKGLFVVLKTSNAGSSDFQDQPLQTTKRPLYESIAAAIDHLGKDLVGQSGYSSIGAVIGATFPEEAHSLRALIPQAVVLVPGYGAQGASARNAAACFREDGLGALVSSSRGITYTYSSPDISREAFIRTVRENTLKMIDDVTNALKPSHAAL
jgi:orotidine-5'-phosphate decarboxylase